VFWNLHKQFLEYKAHIIYSHYVFVNYALIKFVSRFVRESMLFDNYNTSNKVNLILSEV